MNNLVIYHLITDRFLNSDPFRAEVYGRPWGRNNDLTYFQGGNYAGIINKLRDGWFNKIGVNALLISAPYEQIHGWVSGGDPGLKHYAYHGYYALDYTVVDKSYGNERDFELLVNEAHARGIKVVIDIVMNHPGYPDEGTFAELNLPYVSVQSDEKLPFQEHTEEISQRLQDWWGNDWIRSNLPGYSLGGSDDLTKLIYGLPDFKTESVVPVGLPRFLQRKADSLSKPLDGSTVRSYLIAWLTYWVEKFGVDGFRCDSAKHVELAAWDELRSAANKALKSWRHKQNKGEGKAAFLMLGEVFGHGVENSQYHHVFNAMLNFSFQEDLYRGRELDDIYSEYARRIETENSNSFVSYISSHDTFLFPRERMQEAALSLLLCPGAILIFYGDETGRLAAKDCNGAAEHGTRSKMNWDTIDTGLLSTFKKVGDFRSRHPAICSGKHRKISTEPYAFVRFERRSADLVVAIFSPSDGDIIDVSSVFNDGERVFDELNLVDYVVSAGRICLRRSDLSLIVRPQL